MNGKYLLDTNIVIQLINSDAKIVERVARAADAIVCPIVLGELYYGAYKSRAVSKNLARIEDVGKTGAALVCDDHTADKFGKIKSELRAKGRPIPDNDIWIAALARQHQLTIVTRDQHFKHVDRLAIEEW